MIFLYEWFSEFFIENKILHWNCLSMKKLITCKYSSPPWNRIFWYYRNKIRITFCSFEKKRRRRRIFPSIWTISSIRSIKMIFSKVRSTFLNKKVRGLWRRCFISIIKRENRIKGNYSILYRYIRLIQDVDEFREK